MYIKLDYFNFSGFDLERKLIEISKYILWRETGLGVKDILLNFWKIFVTKFLCDVYRKLVCRLLVWDSNSNETIWQMTMSLGCTWPVLWNGVLKSGVLKSGCTCFINNHKVHIRVWSLLDFLSALETTMMISFN